MEDISEEYRIAYKEVLEVLKHMEPEYQQRVPLKMLRAQCEACCLLPFHELNKLFLMT